MDIKAFNLLNSRYSPSDHPYRNMPMKYESALNNSLVEVYTNQGSINNPLKCLLRASALGVSQAQFLC